MKFDIKALSALLYHQHLVFDKCVLVSTTDRKRKQKANTSLGFTVTKLLVDSTKTLAQFLNVISSSSLSLDQI